MKWRPCHAKFWKIVICYGVSSNFAYQPLVNHVSLGFHFKFTSKLKKSKKRKIYSWWPLKIPIVLFNYASGFAACVLTFNHFFPFITFAKSSAEYTIILIMQVRCKQVRRVDHMSSHLKESNIDSEPFRSSSTGICYSVEIKDAYLPPWVISGVCNAMRSNGGEFQARYPNSSLVFLHYSLFFWSFLFIILT